jgi:hypothetical protein
MLSTRRAHVKHIKAAMISWIIQKITTKITLTKIPYLMKVKGKMIIELPIMELATEIPVRNTDFPISTKQL